MINLSSLCHEALISIGPLLAAAPRRANQAETGQMLVYLLSAAAVITAVCVVMAGITHFVRKRRAYSHSGLFAGLCKEHGLDRSNRQLMVRIARHFRLKHPARLFLEPQLLDPAKLASVAGGDSRKLAALQMRLR